MHNHPTCNASIKRQHTNANKYIRTHADVPCCRCHFTVVEVAKFVGCKDKREENVFLIKNIVPPLWANYCTAKIDIIYHNSKELRINKYTTQQNHPSANVYLLDLHLPLFFLSHIIT